MKKLSVLIILFASLANVFVHAMEPVIMSDERVPLLAQEDTQTPAALSMMDDQEDTAHPNFILFDGTRRFYDSASKHALWAQSAKRCLCNTALNTICAGCIGSCLGGAVGAVTCLWGTNHLVTYTISGTALCSGSGCLASLMTYLSLSAQENANAAEKLAWENRLEIPESLRAASSDSKLIWVEKKSLETLLYHAATKDARGRDDLLWPWIGRLATCYYRKEKQTIEKIRQRVEQNRPKITYQLLFAFQKLKIPKKVALQILSSIDFPDDEQEIYITQQEIMYLLQDLGNHKDHSPLVHDYARLILLAQNGWISFARSEKYTVECQLQYFDQNSLPASAKQWYSLGNGPTIFLPKPSQQIMQYYKFNEDPHHTGNNHAN